MTDTISTTDDTTDEPAGIPGSEGYGVTLHMHFEGADDPADAVDLFMRETLSVGLANFAYTVRDTATGDIAYVEDEKIYTEEEFGAHLENREAAGDDGGD